MLSQGDDQIAAKTSNTLGTSIQNSGMFFSGYSLCRVVLFG